MQGKIKMFNTEKGYGFIFGEDGYDYFCHISEIHSMDMPVANSIVEFEASSSEKGRKAINVKVIQRFEQRPEFINLGKYRIKINKIKEYNVSIKTERESIYQGSGFFKKITYADVNKYYLYVTMIDDSYYTVKYETKERLDEACKILDKLLGTINL